MMRRNTIDLTKSAIEKAVKSGKKTEKRVSKGLYISVTAKGSANYLMKATIKGTGERVANTAGNFNATSLTDAKLKAAEFQAIAAKGINPKGDEREPSTARTFAAFAKMEYEAKTNPENEKRWKSDKTRGNWIQLIERYAYPKIGSKPVDEIRQEHVLAIVKPVWDKSHENGRRLRRYIKGILKRAQSWNAVQFNVAGEVIDAALEVKISGEHLPALPYAEVADFLKAARKSKRPEAAKLCLEFLILSVTRSAEARNAAWSEIDFQTNTWTIPKERMKSRKADHRIPLSSAAVAVLEQAKALDNGNGFVFPASRGAGGVDAYNMRQIIKDAGLKGKATIHGFRASFRSWAMNETDSDFYVMELCLAHQVGDAVVKAYARGDLFSKRQILMSAWANYIIGK